MILGYCGIFLGVSESFSIVVGVCSVVKSRFGWFADGCGWFFKLSVDG